MFMHLVTLGEGAEDTRRRTSQMELLSFTENTDLMEEIIDHFASYRLLSLDHDPETRHPTVEVAHEAILREWDRLRQWLNESCDDIRQEHAIARAAEEWHQHKRDKSYLLRRVRLEQVEKWQETTRLLQTPLEQEFIRWSLEEWEKETLAEIARQKREVQLEKRSRDFLRALVVVFVSAAIVSAGFGIFAFFERNYADTARDEAQQSAAEFRSIALTFGAQDALESEQPDVALAQEAIAMDEPPVISNRIFHIAGSASWIQQRFNVSDNGVRDVIYHPNEYRLIVAAADGRTIIYDLETGQELQSIQRDGIAVDLAVNNAGTLVAIGGDMGLVQVWNLETNSVEDLLYENELHSAPVFSADGTLLVTGSDGKILVWDLGTFALRNVHEAYEQGQLMGIHFSNDESLLVSSLIKGDTKGG
jgi:hypothetical protein